LSIKNRAVKEMLAKSDAPPVHSKVWRWLLSIVHWRVA